LKKLPVLAQAANNWRCKNVLESEKIAYNASACDFVFGYLAKKSSFNSHIMMLRSRAGSIFLGIAILFLCATAIAQTEPSFVTALKDTRFNDVVEDWTSPDLAKSHLQPAQPLIGFVDEQSGYSVSLIRLQWRRGDPIDLWLMKPSGVKKPPVILYLYGYPSDTDIFKDRKWQQFTTSGGFASVGFVTALTGHRYHDVPWAKWFVSELQECMAISAHDVQMVLNYLASRGDLDLDRVGMFAQLSGASVAILASAVDPRIKVLEALDPWGDWPIWMEKSAFVPREEQPNYIKPEFLSKVSSVEPLEWMPKVQAKKFRLQQRMFEGETPVAVKEKLQAAVPPGAIVVSYQTVAQFAEATGEGSRKSLDWIKKEVRALQPAAPELSYSGQK
jgi:hypothetical protein